MRRQCCSILEKIAVILLCACLLSALGEIYPAALGAGLAREISRKFQKGMCYVAWDKERYQSPYSDRSLERLAETGTNSIGIVTTWYQKNADSTEILPTENTPTDESLLHAIRKSHALGLRVMLKPHIDLVETGEGGGRGDIFFRSEEGWKEWFANYRIFIAHYARLAEISQVELLCVGTELSTTVEKADEWLETIRAVRKHYSGLITYAANWNDEFEKIQFWNELDFAGIDAYFPLSQTQDPPPEELKAVCEVWVKRLEAWAKPMGKPIIFTEVGYSSAACAAMTPWEEKSPGGADLNLQAKCYRTLLETIWGKEWLAGIYWWRWHATPNAGGVNNKGFTPQNKPAQKVLVEWYKK